MRTRSLRPALLLALAGLPAAADVTPSAGMVRYPDVSKSHIAFVYAGGIWIVPRAGGVATRIADPAGSETFPKFSPDGATLAFVGNYEGNRDLYTIPVAGGTASRVTYHPSGETLNDWSPDGKSLVYTTTGLGGLRRQSQLMSVPAAGGMPTPLPVPYGANAALNADGTWLAYTPHSTDNRTWKRYRGGMATDIWLLNLADKSSKQITTWEGNDTIPMWHKDKVYYLTDMGPTGYDGDFRMNIWVYDTKSGTRTQLTKFKDFDVRWPSIGPGPSGEGEIVFQNGSSVYLLALGGGQPKAVEITIPGDRPAVRARQVNAAEFIRGWSISPSGKRVATEARGDIWSLPADKGSPRNLSRSSGSAQRDPSWSPDGKWIAYFSDETGEYELYITQSDGLGRSIQLTKPGDAPHKYRYNPTWSPDSKMIVFMDKGGDAYLHTLGEDDGSGGVKPGKTVHVDADPWGNTFGLNWSHDSKWLTYTKQEEGSPQSAVWLYNVENAKKTKVTSGMFDDASPTFDRKGDYLWFVSKRNFAARYSDLDTTFIYTDSQRLYAIPLKADAVSPWAPKSDEEEWRKPKDAAKEGKDKKDEEKSDKPAAKKDDLTGAWDCNATGPEPLPPGGMNFSMNLTLGEGGKVTGSITSPLFTGEIENGKYESGTLTFSLTVGEAQVLFTLKFEGGALSGTAEVEGASYKISAKKLAGEGKADAKADPKKSKDVVIDLEGMEARALQLPVAPGRFGRLAVNDKNQLLYARFGDESGIKLFDMTDDARAEKTVGPGGNFDITPDGKKLLIPRGSSATIQDASAGSTGKPVVTSPMLTTINPKEEWAQVFKEAWRVQRDFFYVANLHGVDWKGIGERYAKQVEECATRDDLSYVISELISELNIGHAYYRETPEVESGPSVSVGMLGCDFELVKGDGPDAASHYRISAIHRGAAWDLDAVGPLSQPGCNVKVGDYLLAVNGVPVDASKDPWAAFVGLGGRTITITVNDTPSLARTEEKDEPKTKVEGEKDEPKKPKTTGLRDVVVTTITNEDTLRYRSWIEANRAYVEKQTGGKVGYIYVPNTGVDGQSDLFRQFYGQAGKQALIIDERWNGGGQIPTRFIELLNRPITNYWARREGPVNPWPPDSMQGPKCMLINGLAGSGGDMFPWLFKQNGLGKLIGTRTWGGLVGISGGPTMVDGSSVTPPTFGFFKKDGTWGVEGHGVDPDMVVIDDPAKMQPGADGWVGDPQLDAAIAHMLAEIQRAPYIPPKRPADPDRSGMGLPEKDR